VSGQTAPSVFEGVLAGEKSLLQRAKHAALFCAGVAYQTFKDGLEQQQEVSAAISDMMTDIFAAESAVLRTEKLLDAGRGEAAHWMTQALVQETMSKVEQSAISSLSGSSEGPALDQQVKGVKKFLHFTPRNAIALRRSIAGKLRAAERYIL
jgi:hypothetical protein